MITIDEKFKKEVGDRIKELRRSCGYTQSELAEKMTNEYHMSIDEKSISRYEKGENLPKLDNLIVMADALKTTLDYIIYGKETSDDNSFTIYDTFKRFNRLICSLFAIPAKNNEGKIYLILNNEEAKLYFEILNAYGAQSNYQSDVWNRDPTMTVKDMDALFEKFKKYDEQLVPSPERLDALLEAIGTNLKEYHEKRTEEISKKRRV